MNEHTTQVSGPFVAVGGGDGRTVIRIDSPLRRLNYFDGKFLRAEDLRLEQSYLRALIHLSNQAGGPGVVHGFDVALQGDRLLLGPGLAIDAAGHVLLLEGEGEALPLRDLFRRSGLNVTLDLSSAPSPAGAEFDDCAEGELRTFEPLQAGDRFVVSLSYAEGECGNEPVYGRLCEAACVTDTARPYRIDGLVVRVRPLRLSTPLPPSQSVVLGAQHLRSRLASAYYAHEVLSLAPDSHVSARGLAHGAWCNGAPEAAGGEVDVAVLARSGSTWFVDSWIVRRERMEAPPRRYWAWRMGMRPWDVYLAQILQFQCQLRDLLRFPRALERIADPCREERRVLRRTAESILKLREQIQPQTEVRRELVEARPERATLAASPELAERLQGQELSLGGAAFERYRDLLQLDDELRVVLDRVRQTTDRVLIDGGIVELPPAGYLPVDPDGGQSANEQVRALLGAGVDLRFCVVRPDYVPHALEEAQHMERISLLAGYDNPRALPPVDVLVPDGRIQERVVLPPGRGYEMELTFTPFELPGVKKAAAMQKNLASLSRSANTPPGPITLYGAARSEKLPAGGSAFYFAGLTSQRRRALGELETILDRWRKSVGERQATAEAPAQAPATAEAPAAPAPAHHHMRSTASIVGLPPSASPEEKAREAAALEEEAARDAAETAEGEVRTTSTSTGKLFGDRAWLPRETLLDLTNSPQLTLADIPFLRLKTAQLETSFWADLQMERDLFDPAGESYSRVEARLVLLHVDADGAEVTSISFSGDVHVQRRSRERDGSIAVQAVLAGHGQIRVREPGAATDIATLPLDVREELVLERRTGPDGLAVSTVHVPRPRLFSTLRSPLPPFRFTRRWTELDAAATVRGERELSTSLSSGRTTQQPMTRDLSASAGTSPAYSAVWETIGRRTFTLFEASQRVEQGVLVPGHKAHAASTTAIRHLHSGLRELGFADLAAQRLFPPPRFVEARDLIVHPTLDWVLFHRRRDKQCRPEVEAAPRVRSRTFRLYHVRLESEEERERLDAVLRRSRAGDLGDFEAQSVALVEFGPGVSTVLTPRRLVGTRWEERVGAGGEIVYAALAAEGDAADESGPLGSARVQSLVEILEEEQMATLDEDAPLTVLPRVPDALGAEDVDGVLVVASVAAGVECHDVYHLPLGDLSADVIRGRLEANPTTLPQWGATRIGEHVEFRAGGSEVTAGADPLTAAWEELQEPRLGEVWVIVPRGIHYTEADLREAQADAVARLVEPDHAVKVSILLTDGTIPGDCGIVTVLVTEPAQVETVCNEVLYFPSIERTDLTDDVVRSRLKLFSDALAGLDESALAEFHPMGVVNFLAGSASPADGTLQSLPQDARLPDGTTWANAFANGLQGRRIGYLAVSPKDTPLDDARQHLLQAEAIRGVLGDSLQAVPAVLGGGLTRQCGAVTLAIVFVNSFGQQMVRAMVVAEGDAAPREVQFHFDDQGEVVRDESFERSVRTLQDAKVSLGSVELASPVEAPDAEDRRLLSLYDALRGEGLVTDDAQVETRKLDPQAAEVSPDLVFEPSVFFFRTRRQ